MKHFFKLSSLLLVLVLATGNLSGQTFERRTYMGLGLGLDYGGVGVKVELLPVDHLGIFAGVGYNLSSAGWNVGAAFKITPTKRVCPNIVAFYGYNGVFVGGDSYAEKYNSTSYGFTVGGNLDIKVNSKGHKLTFGLFAPIRSKSFMDKYNAAKNDPYLDITSELLPVAFSFGFNWAI